MVAHKDAIDKITKIDPRIHLIPAEILTHQESFYTIFDENNNNQEYVNFTNQIIKTQSLSIKFPFGFNDQAILYGLDLSTPNNNHSFIYHDKKWNPLLRR